MKAYTIYEYSDWGFTEHEEYALKYDKAIQILNSKVKDAIRKNKEDLATGNDFGEFVQDTRKYINDSKSFREDDRVIVCRHEPYVMTYSEDEKEIAVVIPVWEKTSYEYEEYDVRVIKFILKEIEIQ
ncbi:hypothetical protein [Clostridium butyricum]|uniref:hypothetical protein n=1 Tax=Clostridium butyricum TaxID=1492 RepID=UPI0009040B02|nr:hypothetical protein [Clostridium butyricum]APF21444.1 hypothetical protein NPD4_3509 [Clostridium butyricum]